MRTGLDGAFGFRKIFIVGIVASGKTTLARKLSAQTGIPWHELDNIVHRRAAEGGTKRTAEEQRETIEEIDRQGSWIFEGTDRPSYSYLYDMADLVIFLDPPLWKRRLRIVTRFIKQKLGWEACHYKPNRMMLKRMFGWTADFERTRPQFEAMLERYAEKVLRISDGKEAGELGIGRNNRSKAE